MPQERIKLKDFKMPKVHKYGAKACIINGIPFPSRKEGNRYAELILMQHGGYIRDLEIQVRFDIEVNGIHVCQYIADFTYWDVKQGRKVVEDAKGFKTDVYRLKRKLMRACYGIDIIET
jgi:uncharacterized protein DUF1064